MMMLWYRMSKKLFACQELYSKFTLPIVKSALKCNKKNSNITKEGVDG